MSAPNLTIAALAAALALPALAQAQALSTAPSASKPALVLADNTVDLRGPAAAAQSVSNRTSVDHTFGPDQLTVSAGYLCGLAPPSDRTPGPASTFGPLSTFLGGKLSYAFK